MSIDIGSTIEVIYILRGRTSLFRFEHYSSKPEQSPTRYEDRPSRQGGVALSLPTCVNQLTSIGSVQVCRDRRCTLNLNRNALARAGTLKGIRCLFHDSPAAWFTSSPFGLCGAVFDAAARILARCNSENPPELVEQSRLGFALQSGHAKEIGLKGKTSGMGCGAFAISEVYVELSSCRYPCAAPDSTAPSPSLQSRPLLS